jgi:hypothetical protein
MGLSNCARAPVPKLEGDTIFTPERCSKPTEFWPEPVKDKRIYSAQKTMSEGFAADRESGCRKDDSMPQRS